MRVYVPSLGRFASADTIVPDPTNPQAFNRFSYVENNPINFNDPTGHCKNGRATRSSGPCSSPPPAHTASPTTTSKLTPEQKLLNSLVKPTESLFRPFGGPMTSSNCDVAARPPCDARHPAVDASGLRGQSIYAAAYGKVVLIGNPHPALDGRGATGGFGRYVVVEHKVQGVLFYSIYAHNEEILVEVGDVVKSGDLIATMGDSGTTNVHLHFEIRRKGNIDWGATNPFQTQIYWPQTVTELTVNFVDLGSVFGYHNTYDGWATDNP